MADPEQRPLLHQPVVNAPPPSYYEGYPQPNHQGPPQVVALTQPKLESIQGKMVCAMQGNRDWSSGLCDCTEDLTNCVLVCCCPPIVLCNLASRLNEFVCFPFCVPGGSINMRTRIRTLGGIQGTICSDCVTMTFCGQCALCQMKREMDQMEIH